MQRGSDLQPQDPQPAELTEVTDVEMSSGSYDEEMPEEEGEADGRSGGSTSSVGASSDMDTATETVDSEHQVQQCIEPYAENDDLRSTGTGTTGAEESLILEAGAAIPREQWAQTAASLLQGLTPNRHPRRTPTTSLGLTEPNFLLKTVRRCHRRSTPHRVTQTQRLGKPRSHRSPTPHRSRTLKFCLRTGSSASCCPWV
ncbi:trans-sialidase [Trypanosoma cruzi]|nr:trans-sialidase [Trypanosoma cruzi]